jgi:hypothetical protein
VSEEATNELKKYLQRYVACAISFFQILRSIKKLYLLVHKKFKRKFSLMYGDRQLSNNEAYCFSGIKSFRNTKCSQAELESD